MVMRKQLPALLLSAAALTTGAAACSGEAQEESSAASSAALSQIFQAPVTCGQSWTYSHHGSEVRLALDFLNNGGPTDGAPVLASASGVATRRYQEGGAGNYISIDHGGGWQTYYFHLQSYSVPSGAQVQQGQEVGRVGSTGASSGPHLHFEQLLNGVGQTISFDGQSLGPYPGSYGQRSVTSRNCSGGGTTCPGGTGTVVGAIDAKYKALGACGSVLGRPTTDERMTPDTVGRYSVFERGSIYWTPSLGAFEVHGVIRDRWAALEWEPGVLGYPVSDEMGTPDGVGRYNVFERGSVYWTPATGAHEVLGRIRDTWKTLGWEAGALGYPISGEYDVAGGRKSDFQNGSITWTESTDETTVLMNQDGGAPEGGASDGG